jgi:hypothetical protein
VLLAIPANRALVPARDLAEEGVKLLGRLSLPLSQRTRWQHVCKHPYQRSALHGASRRQGPTTFEGMNLVALREYCAADLARGAVDANVGAALCTLLALEMKESLYVQVWNNMFTSQAVFVVLRELAVEPSLHIFLVALFARLTRDGGGLMRFKQFLAWLADIVLTDENSLWVHLNAFNFRNGLSCALDSDNMGVIPLQPSYKQQCNCHQTAPMLSLCRIFTRLVSIVTSALPT